MDSKIRQPSATTGVSASAETDSLLLDSKPGTQNARTQTCGLRAIINWLKSLFKPSIESLVNRILTVSPQKSWDERVADILQRFQAAQSSNYESLYSLEVKMVQVKPSLVPDIAAVRRSAEKQHSVLAKTREMAILPGFVTLDTSQTLTATQQLARRVASAFDGLPDVQSKRMAKEQISVLLAKLQNSRITAEQFQKNTLKFANKFFKAMGATDREKLLQNFKSTIFPSAPEKPERK